MAIERDFITGAVLAGGRGQRMGGEDKGLILFKGRPLVSYALESLRSVAGSIVLNVNRNHEKYACFGYPIVTDQTMTFDGPLAGLLSVMQAVKTPYVLTVPCDSPLITGAFLSRLGSTLAVTGSELCVAHDGKRLQPLFLLADRCLLSGLEQYLAAGQRKVEIWLRLHRWVVADFSDHPELFGNINTPEDLTTLEMSACEKTPPRA
jgi:molybdopterin-guanine dinucleotide biosynthesis protein A